MTVKDRYASAHDNGIQLGRAGHASPMAIQLGAGFDLGNWLSSAVSDIGGVLEDGVNAVGGLFKGASDFQKALDWIVDGPIFHVAAGVCAIIPGGVAASAAIEAAYWGIKAASDIASEAIEAVEPILEAGEDAVRGLAKIGEIKLSSVTPAQATAALSGLGIDSSLAANLMLATVQIVDDFPDLLNVKGVGAFAIDKRLPVAFRALAVVQGMHASNFKAALPGGQVLAGYLSGKIDLANFKPVIGLGNAQDAVLQPLLAKSLLAVLKQYGIPSKLPTPVKQVVQPSAMAATFAAKQKALAAQLAKDFAELPVKPGQTLYSKQPMLKDFPKLVSVKILLPSEKFEHKYNTVQAADFVKLFWRFKAIGPDGARKLVAGLFADKSLDDADKARTLFLMEPYRPSLTQSIMLHNRFPTTGDGAFTQYGIEGLKRLDDLWGLKWAGTLGNQLRTRFLSLPIQAQLDITKALFKNVRTKDNAPFFLRAVYGSMSRDTVTVRNQYSTWFAVPFFDSAKLEKLGIDGLGAEIVKAQTLAAKNYAAAILALEATDWPILEAPVSAVVAHTDLPRKRAGVKVELGNPSAVVGNFELVDTEGFEAVISADGTADLGTWKAI